MESGAEDGLSSLNSSMSSVEWEKVASMMDDVSSSGAAVQQQPPSASGQLFTYDVIVQSVDNSPGECRLLCKACTPSGDVLYPVLLRGFWAQSKVAVNSAAKIVLAHKASPSASCPIIIDDTVGLLVVEPSFLLPVTSITGAVVCRRRSQLSEVFRLYEAGNLATLTGSLVHRLMQRRVSTSIAPSTTFATDLSALTAILEEMLQEPTVLKELYLAKVSSKQVFEETYSYLHKIESFSNTYIEKHRPLFDEGHPLTICDVQDIEECIHSQRYGVRGRVDVTLKVTDSKSNEFLLPLEIKTGKSVPQVEHQGQVILYSCMLGDRHDQQPFAGLLLYLRDGSLHKVDVSHRDVSGLLQIRNELVYHMKANRRCEQPSFSEPITQKRICQWCEQRTTCFLLQKLQGLSEGGSDPAFIDETLSHLTAAHLDYFDKWLRWLFLESAEQRKRRNGAKSAIDEDLKDSQIYCEDVFLRVTVEDMVLTDEKQRYKMPFSDGQVDCSEVFACGDFVVLDNETTGETALRSGYVLTVESEIVRVKTQRQLGVTDGDIFILKPWKHDYMQNGLNLSSLCRLMMPTSSGENIRKFVIDLKEPEFHSKLPSELISHHAATLKRLNKEQSRAVIKSLLCKSYFLIKGFPGTGKTTTIITLIKILVASGQSVLLCGHTHSSVDNVLLSLKKSYSKILRLGSEAKVHPEISEFLLDRQIERCHSEPEVSDLFGQCVVACTCLTAAAHPLFSSRQFDVCILDEASLTLECSVLVPLLAAKRFILIGDPIQLRPIVICSVAREEGMAISLFEKLEATHAGCVTSLTKQYRMNRQISSLSSALFYDHRLRCATEALENLCIEFNNGTKAVSDDDPNWLKKCLSTSICDAVVFIDTSTSAYVRCKNLGAGCLRNDGEAAVAGKVCDRFIKAGLSSTDIGVVCFYSYQVKVVKSVLLKGGPQTAQIEVSTVDAFQGREKDVILISFVWTNGGNDRPNPLSVLLSDRRRINVALTRARKKLVLIGNKSDLSTTYPIVGQLVQYLTASQCVCVEKSFGAGG